MGIKRITVLAFLFVIIIQFMLMFAASFMLVTVIGHFQTEMSYTHVVAWWFAIYFSLLAITWTCFYYFTR